MWKFAPGDRPTPFRHDQTKQLFVREGERVCQEQARFPGDHHRSDADSVQEETTYRG